MQCLDAQPVEWAASQAGAELLHRGSRFDSPEVPGANPALGPPRHPRISPHLGIVGADANGRASIEWGVYGVPETFIVGREGKIVYKLVGPITRDNIRTVLMPEIEKALKAGS